MHTSMACDEPLMIAEGDSFGLSKLPPSSAGSRGGVARIGGGVLMSNLLSPLCVGGIGVKPVAPSAICSAASARRALKVSAMPSVTDDDILLLSFAEPVLARWSRVVRQKF